MCNSTSANLETKFKKCKSTEDYLSLIKDCVDTIPKCSYAYQMNIYAIISRCVNACQTIATGPLSIR